MSDQYCDRCGVYIPDSSLRYSIHIQILSDFDGIILYEGEDAEEETQKIFHGIEDIDENELDEDIFQELTFILCGNCKKSFARDPFNRRTGLFKINKSMDRLFH